MTVARANSNVMACRAGCTVPEEWLERECIDTSLQTMVVIRVS